MDITVLKENLRESIFRTSSRNEEIALNDHINLDADLGYTSMEMIQLIVDLENLFDIEIPDEYLNDEMYNYGNIEKIIISLVMN